MRTKTLLLTAALSAAGIATSMAQVYSVNAVGYVNAPIAGNNGFTLVANQFTTSSYAISNVIPTAPLGATVYIFVGNNYQASEFNEFTSAWSNPTLPLNLGRGFFILNPQAATSLTFVGEVPQGTLTTTISPGFSILSSQVPQAGTVTALGLAAAEGDAVYRFLSGSQSYAVYTKAEFTGEWVSNTPGQTVDPVNGPALSVGEAIFFNSVGTPAATWSRNFTVN